MALRVLDNKDTSVKRALSQKLSVMSAVALRDMRTRFFNHGLGFLVITIWPLAHMVILLAIYNFAGRKAPYGDSLNVFFATGLIPTMAFTYISRFMSISILLNRPMLSFPAVTVIDIMAARAFLEIIAASLTLLFMFLILYFLGENVAPNDPSDALLAYLATILLGIGVGSLAGVIVMFFDFFVTIYALFMIIVYISSGTLFVASALPDQYAYALSWNPVFQCVEWMRGAYYDGYNERLLDRSYVIGFGLIALMLGLFLERVFRRRIFDS